MKTVLTLLFVLVISVTTEALVCRKCNNYHGLTCVTYTDETCADTVTDCYTNVVVDKIGPITNNQISRGCAKDKYYCLITFNMTSGTASELFSTTSCCNTDQCNKDPVKLAPKNTTENGLDCPSCLEKGSTCKQTQTIKCQGLQDNCYHFSGSIYNGITGKFEEWTSKGCTTGEVCKLNEFPPDYEISFLKKGCRMDCTKKLH